MTAANQSYLYTNIASFGSCTGCHADYVGTPGFFSFNEAWSESSDYSIFNSFCAAWNLEPLSSYYGNRAGGCLLYLVDNGDMPSGSPGTWIYQDEYLQWYCSNQGPGGNTFGF